MKSVYCVLKSGGVYSERHVKWLKRQCDQFLPETPFFCLTDIDSIEGVQTIPLIANWEGWWSKIELFQFDDVFYIDLDTVLVNDIRYMLKLSGFHALKNFKGHKRWFRVVAQSSIMTWDKSPRHIYENFRPAIKKRYENKKKQNNWGDQGYINECLKGKFNALQDQFPGRIQSYKLDNLGTEKPDADIICFHGSPRPWEANVPWVPALQC
jgi:hypothetical protein